MTRSNGSKSLWLTAAGWSANRGRSRAMALRWPRTFSTRSSGFLYRGLDRLLRDHTQPGRHVEHRRLVDRTPGIPKGDPVEHDVRGSWSRLWKRSAHGTLLSAGRGLPLFPKARHDQTAVVPSIAGAWWHQANLDRRGAVCLIASPATSGVGCSEARPNASDPDCCFGTGVGRCRSNDLSGPPLRALLDDDCLFRRDSDWIAGAKAVQLALWFWAGVSKLNHHFPAVVCVMTSNSPTTPFAALRRRMYRHYPDDLRPSPLATMMSTSAKGSNLVYRSCCCFRRADGPLRWGSSDAPVARIHHQQRAHGSAHRMEFRGRLRSLRAVLGPSRRDDLRPRLNGGWPAFWW